MPGDSLSSLADAACVTPGPIDNSASILSPGEPIRSNCPYCGAEVVGRHRMCLVHLVADPDWAAANRAMCDFIHRGLTIDNVPLPSREVQWQEVNQYCEG